MSDGIPTFLFGAAFGLLIGFMGGNDFKTSAIHREAVEAGAGEYYLDADHQRQFRWVTQEREGE